MVREQRSRIFHIQLVNKNIISLTESKYCFTLLLPLTALLSIINGNAPLRHDLAHCPRGSQQMRALFQTSYYQRFLSLLRTWLARNKICRFYRTKMVLAVDQTLSEGGAYNF